MKGFHPYPQILVYISAKRTQFKRHLEKRCPEFSLSKTGKACAIEMFLATKLDYAMKFYPIPTHFQKGLQTSIFQYANFQKQVHQ